jgi:tellurite resistance protein TerC
METIGNPWLYLAFFAIVIVMLLIDFLGFKQKEGQEVKIKTAAYWSIAWVSVIWWWFMAVSTTNRGCFYCQ